MTRKDKLRRYFIILFFTSVIFTGVFSYYYMLMMVPNHLSVIVNEEEQFNFKLPFGATLSSQSEEVMLGNTSNIPSNEINMTLDKPFSIYSNNEGEYTLGLKLFGWLDFKNIQVDVVDTRYVIPCGLPIGIYLESKGILVIGTGEVSDAMGAVQEPANGILKSGDYILKVNDRLIDNKETLIKSIDEYGSEPVVLTIRRGSETLETKLDPVCTATGEYKLGIWVRDDTQGIGTLSYIDPNGNFGALGHGISDTDTGEIMEVKGGTLYETEIQSIQKGTIGKPGVMSGIIYYGENSVLGKIATNTTEGIFGTINDKLNSKLTMEPMEIGYKQDVKTGEAWIRSNVSGELKDYKINIQRVDTSNSNKNKGMVIKVEDEDLLAITGGIVQGMSGSPIMQDGKLIGAVTHVFVQDSTKGYGIFIENMLKTQFDK